MKKIMLPVVILGMLILLIGCDMLFGFKLEGTKWKCTLTSGGTPLEIVINFTSKTNGTATTYQNGNQVSEPFTYTWDAYAKSGTVTNPQNETYTIYLSEDKQKLLAEQNGFAIVYKREN